MFARGAARGYGALALRRSNRNIGLVAFLTASTALATAAITSGLQEPPSGVEGNSDCSTMLRARNDHSRLNSKSLALARTGFGTSVGTMPSGISIVTSWLMT